MSFSCEGFWDHWREILELPLKQRHELEVQKKGKLDKHLPVELACDYRKLLLMKQTSGLHWKVIATSGLVVECMCWMWKVM